MDLITSIFNILASQAFGTLMQNLTKAVLFVMSLPLIYFVATQPLGDRKTSASERNSPSRPRLGERSAPYICIHMYIYAEQEREREREVCLADQEWTREVCKAVQEWKRETLYRKWVQSEQNRYAAGIVNGSRGIFGLQQAAEVWKLSHPSESIQNSNPYSSHVLWAKTWGPNTDAFMLAPWYRYVVFTIICRVILSALIGFYIKSSELCKIVQNVISWYNLGVWLHLWTLQSK